MKKYIFTFVILLYQLASPNVVAPPIANMIGNQAICDEGPLIDGIENFNLTSYSSLILLGNPLPLSNYTVAFYLTQNDALNNMNPIANPQAYNGSNGQTIYVRVTDSTTSEYSVTNFGLVVNLPPQTLAPSTLLTTCDTDFNDGYLAIDLNSYKTQLLNGLPASNNTIVFYPTLIDASNYSNPINNPSNYYARTGPIYYWCTNNVTGCGLISWFDVVIEQPPTPLIVNEAHTICVNYLSNSVETPLLLESENTTSYLNSPQVPMPSYLYQWYMNGVPIPGTNSPNFLINFPLSNNNSAIFTVTMSSMTVGSCITTSQDYVVYQSGQASPIGIGYSIVNNSGNLTVTATVQGYGIYQYSLDGGSRQDSPVFNNVSVGSHTITVWDTEGGPIYSCNPLILNINAQLGAVDFTEVDYQISPNPVIDFVKIRSNDVIHTIEIYNLLGQLVYMQNTNEFEELLDLKYLKSGNYIAKIQSENNVGAIKLIKN